MTTRGLFYIDPHGDGGAPKRYRWKWFRLLRVFFQPLALWQEPPEAYPAWSVGLLWYLAHRFPLRFDPRHPEGPRRGMSFQAFDYHKPAIEQWLFYACRRDDARLFSWWPQWFMESGLLAMVTCVCLWEKGAVFLWEHSGNRSTEGLFGRSVNNHPQFGTFLKGLDHAELSQLSLPTTVQWSGELLQWISDGRLDCVQPWIEMHRRHPRQAWEYLGDGSQLHDPEDFFLFLSELSQFDARFPLADGWNWAKVFALYGANVFYNHYDAKDNWSTCSQAWVDAAYIARRHGYRVPDDIFVQGIDLKLDLYLSHRDWPSWTGLERIAALCSQSKAVDTLAIDGLV